MKGIIGYDHEITALKANRLGLMIRPLKKQPQSDWFKLIHELKQMQLVWLKANGFTCPYPPGTQVFIKEKWGMRSDGTRSYKNDGFKFNGHYWEHGEVRIEHWYQSRSMKEEHARFKPFFQSVNCKRLQEITEEEAKAWGLETVDYFHIPKDGIMYTTAWMGSPYKESFETMVKSLWPGAWEANKFCWLYSIDNNSK